MSDKHARDKIMQMTPEELREAIAEARGYIVNHNYLDDYGVSIKYYWIAPSGLLTTMCPDWTVYITDAWELAEEIPDIRLRKLEDGDDLFWRCCCDYSCEFPKITVDEESAPLSISRCWLMWREE